MRCLPTYLVDLTVAVTLQRVQGRVLCNGLLLPVFTQYTFRYEGAKGGYSLEVCLTHSQSAVEGEDSKLDMSVTTTVCLHVQLCCRTRLAVCQKSVTYHRQC
jgi:hypothetical protein